MAARALVLVVAGARPNFVKAAPLMRALQEDAGFAPWLVHTGQHYDDRLSRVFFEELGIASPDDNLEVGSGSHAQQVGAVMVGLERLIEKRRPTIILTIGDVNSTAAAAIVAAKAEIPQGHVEAGLRSGDPSMPEEVNRVVTDRLADLLFTHSEEATINLAAEGVGNDRIHMVGNIMIDTLMRLRPAWHGRARRELPHLPKDYGVVTLHRPSNVDDPAGLDAIAQALEAVARELPLVFPVHPRTRSALEPSHYPGILLTEPLGYLAFMDLVEHARLVVTDSGGIQEETTVLNVPCLTLRGNTERPITVRLGTNQLIGTDARAIIPAVEAVLARGPQSASVPPMWDGQTSSRIVGVLKEWLKSPALLRLAS